MVNFYINTLDINTFPYMAYFESKSSNWNKSFGSGTETVRARKPTTYLSHFNYQASWPSKRCASRCHQSAS